MARLSSKPGGSPKLALNIDTDRHTKAVRSNSGACLIADTIREQYPKFSSITVDMATIRFSDRTKGLRYIYLTPPAAQHILLSFDQGWPHPGGHVAIHQAVQVHPIIANKTGKRSRPALEAVRAERLFTLEAKEKKVGAEMLSRSEKASLTRIRKAPPLVERPTSRGKAEIKRNGRMPVVVGGRPAPQGPAHPNLLRGRNRHFGAKLADPGVAFREAVETAVAERLNNPQLDLKSD